MAEYIERGKLSADFELCNKQNPRWTPQRVASLIARANASDVAPVVHGDWYGCGNMWMCTVCDDLSYTMTNYCPNCGARMDGE